MIGRDAAQSSLSDDARRVRYTLRVNHPPSPPQLRPPTFVEPMECLAVTKLPDGQQWLYEVLCGSPHKISSVALGVMWR